MTIDLNFTGVERPEFKPVPEGEYRVKVSDLKIATSKSNKANTVANATYEIVLPEEYAGKLLFGNQVVAGESVKPEFVKLWLEALTGMELTGEFSLDPDQLVGLEADCFVGLKPDYNNDTKEVNVIKYWIAPDFT